MISLKNFTFGYVADEPKLNRVNLEIAAGEFVLVCGATGSGKSTLLRAIVGLVPHFTGGNASGSRQIDGIDFSTSMPHESAHLIGYVNQQPEGAFVADTVIEELAFVLEQLAVERTEMVRRVDEALAATGLSELRDRKLSELSGGQQQRVAIAAALSAGQKILVLDEPTSALDPRAARDLLEFIHGLCHSQGLTAVIAEHRIERLVELVDSVVIVNSDGSVSQGDASQQLSNFKFVPPLIELSQKLNWQPVALSISDASQKFEQSPKAAPKKLAHLILGDELISANNLIVDYSKVRAVNNISFSARAGEVIAIAGENGSGKTSLLWALQGTQKLTSGSVLISGGLAGAENPATLSPTERLAKIAMVPQQAADLLFLPTLSEELAQADQIAEAAETTTASLFEQFGSRLDPVIHPRDLSSGQQLSLVLAMQLVKGAPVVLLDEPTRGLDYATKKQVARVLRGLAEKGKGIIFASHDVEFIAQAADRVVQLSSGEIFSDEPVEVALSNRPNNPLVSQTAQITNLEGVIAVEQVVPSE